MKKVVILFTLMVFLLVGCGESEHPNIGYADKDYSSMIVPNILECGDDMSTHNNIYYYIVDENTGVVYLSYDGYKRHAITLMVNRDGSPVTAEQLGIKY